MARIKVIEESEATGSMKALYDGLREKVGYVPNFVKLFSLWPEVFEVYSKLFQTVMFSQSELPNPTKEMIAVVVSRTNRSRYCVTHHSLSLARYGVSEAVVRQIGAGFREAPVDEQTQRLLAYAEKLTQHPSAVTDQDVESLRQAGWTDRQILEATLVVAQFNFDNRMVLGFGAELEPVFGEGGLSGS